MAEREEREQIRCSNNDCPSRHGAHGARILAERGLRTGWFYRKAAKGEIVMVMPVTIPCDTCGQSWLNPGLMLIDGITEIVGGIAERQAERLREDPPEHLPEHIRSRLRRPAAA